jgi:uncharacterized membrane protein YdjX (TVP38/TMEM64 family)
MNKRKILLLALVALLVAAFFALDLGHYLTLTELKARRDELFAAYAAHRLPFILGFIGVYIATTALSLPGATVLTLAGGAVFGAVTATVVVNVGATVGATLAFLVARYLFRDAVEHRLGPRLKAMNEGLTRGALGYLLFLRLVPVFPFFLINLGAGLTQVPLRTYVVATMVGILPGSFVYCNAGANLARIDSLSEIASPGVLGALALLGAFALVPTLFRRLRARRAGGAGEAGRGEPPPGAGPQNR